ncbi:MAG TPA: dethiobiotin synthase [Solirubrobacteraceae bacterium]|nr:dethiobiotin synthase [Solirubrobacteraceae bacterium]
MRGLFVTGTDTGVGKSVLSAALIAAMVAAGERVRAYKPVVTGLDEPNDAGSEAPLPSGASAAERWPPDHELLASVAGMTAEEVSPLRFGPAVSPHLAAELAGARIDPAELLAHARGDADRDVHRSADHRPAAEETLVVEGVGGLLVPLTADYTVCDFAAAVGLPLVIAARPGLGTINHTLLTLHVARSAGLRVCAVVLTPWPEQPTALERSNRETIERLGEIEVQTLAHIPTSARSDLAHAGGALPWRRWSPR